MFTRENALAVVLLAAAGLVVYGVYLLSAPVAFIVGGVLLAALALLVLGEVAE